MSKIVFLRCVFRMSFVVMMGNVFIGSLFVI